MPDYEIDSTNREVAVRLYGNAINAKYAELLKHNEHLSFEDCMLLDAVQKGRHISLEEVHSLMEKGLIEGEYPNIYICRKLYLKAPIKWENM